MRPVRYVLDLPWWVGLVIYLAGNAIVPHFYLIGMPIALFGLWTFSKLMKFDHDAAVGFVIFGLPVFLIVMLIPDRFTFETAYINLLNHITPKVNSVLRASLGIMTGLITCCGIRR
jgi:hypothetical protein